MQQLRDYLQKSLPNAFRAKYRDYMALLLGELKSTVKKYHKEHSEVLTGYWINIQEQLKQEREPNASGLPIHTAVRIVCKTLGIHGDRALWNIEHYAESNQTFHSTIEDRLAAGDVSGVATTLYTDLKNINNLFSTSGVRENDQVKEALTYIIKRHIDLSFTWTEKFKDIPGGWTLTERGERIKERKTQERQLPQAFIEDRTKERLFIEEQRSLAENATREISSGERQLDDLSAEEICAIRKNNPHWREAQYLQASKSLEQKARESQQKALDQLRKAFQSRADMERQGKEEEE